MAERIATLGRRLVAAEDAAVEAEAKAKTLRERADQAEREFWERMDAEDQTTGTWDLGEPYGKVQFQKQSTIRSTIVDKEAALRSVTEAGLADAVIDDRAFRKKPLNDDVKERLRNGEPLLDGVDFTRTKYVTITRKDD